MLAIRRAVMVAIGSVCAASGAVVAQPFLWHSPSRVHRSERPGSQTKGWVERASTHVKGCWDASVHHRAR